MPCHFRSAWNENDKAFRRCPRIDCGRSTWILGGVLGLGGAIIVPGRTIIAPWPRLDRGCFTSNVGGARPWPQSMSFESVKRVKWQNGCSASKVGGAGPWGPVCVD